MKRLILISLMITGSTFISTVPANAAYSQPTPKPLTQIQPIPKQPSFKNPMSQKDFDKCMSSAAANRKCATGR